MRICRFCWLQWQQQLHQRLPPHHLRPPLLLQRLGEEVGRRRSRKGEVASAPGEEGWRHYCRPYDCVRLESLQ